MVASLFWLLLGAAGMATQLDLDCAEPDRARALIDYARLSEIEQVEDIHRDALDKALARCPAGAGREACRSERRRQADLDWERTRAEIKARYDQMRKDFEEKCRASIAGYSGLLISWASSPTTPRRKVSTQTTKISPWTIVTQAPSWAR
jgi:hypothetical protein